MDKSIRNSNYTKALTKNFPLFLILVCGLVVRILFYKSVGSAIETSDTPTYVDGAMSLYYHLWLNEYRPPVYPIGLMLSGVIFTWANLNIGIILLQVLLSFVNIVFVYKLANECFNKKLLSYVAAFITAISFRVYSWDFVVLTENFAILLVTLVAYFLIMYLKYQRKKHLKTLIVFLLVSIFTKPFFMLLPFAILTALLLRYLLAKDFKCINLIKPLATGIVIVYLSIFSYSMINYAENVYFGITTVGNVNYFGKILQYKMEDLGNNPKLITDIKTAFKTEDSIFKVNGEFLEPWHFVGTFGWTKNHYQDVGKFAKEIIFHHPGKFLSESIKLTYTLILNSPFRDFIADGALAKSSSQSNTLLLVNNLTKMFDNLYYLILICFIEVVLVAILGYKFKASDSMYYISILSLFILYHYIVAAFFSYGDYCRLIAPCYPLIYIVICNYISRFINLFASITKSFTSLFMQKVRT